MNPSQQNNRGQINPASTAEQLLGTADVEIILTKMKSATADASEFEIRRGSHPMPASDRSRHRPNNPNIDSEQQLGSSSTPVPLPSMAEGSELASEVVELPVPLQQLDTSSAPRPPSPRLVVSKLPREAMDFIVTQQSSTAALRPALSSNMASPEPITHLPGFDPTSPTVRALLQEAFNEGRSEGRRENQVKLDGAETKIEELRKRLDPSKLKAAYNQGVRDGSIAGYNKYSLNPETKPSDDRLAFENIIQEKNKAIHDQQMITAGYQRELEVAKGQNELMRADLENWQVQWGLITADLEEWKAAFNSEAGQLGSCQKQLETSSRELRETTLEVNRLARAKSEEVGSLKVATKELESKFNTLNFDFNSLDRLYTALAIVAAERLAEIEAGKTWSEEMEGVSKGELEKKNAQLYDAKKQIKELSQKLLAASLQLPQSPPSAPKPSTPHKESPASPPSDSRSWFRPRRLPATDAGTNFSPRRLLIMLFIILLAFLIPYLHSLSQQTNENANSWEAANEVLREEDVHSGLRDDRIRWEAWALVNLEQNEGSPSSQEEGWRRTEEIGRIGGWNY